MIDLGVLRRSLLIIPVSIASAPTAVAGLGREFAQGWTWIVQGPGRPLLQIGAVFATEGFFLGAPALLVTLYAHREFADPSRIYGILFTAYVVGTAIGGLLVTRTNPRGSLGRLITVTMVAEGGAIALAVGVLPMIGPSLAAWFAVGRAGSIPATLFYTYLQATTPSQALGRVISNMSCPPGSRPRWERLRSAPWRRVLTRPS